MAYKDIIIWLAPFLKVPTVLLLAICTHESHLKNIIVENDHGSPTYGICQIKEGAARSVGFNSKSSYLMEPTTNVWYAALYLRKQLDRYNDDWCKAVASYNAGHYNPSTINPGKPKNLKYVEGVTLHLDDEYKDLLICGPRKVASE